ncbi:DUF1028 domain-containing protein [Ferruginibacter yonginensis]|uniref:DUF1028 domain-containing protein n=1 Tax=Ferruginibacter yonginensis TaxID=1310416 RepID=A0ABV8QSB4_9BACT
MKKCIQFMLVAMVCGSQVKAQFFKNDEAFAHTFSIVARDPQTGEMAVGVQSHWFSVGTAVPWGEAGVGVVATQSFVNKSYGPLGLQLMKNGVTATDALQQLLDKDAGKEVRQVAMIDAKGNVNAYTGKNCIDYANHIVGNNYSVQSNMMLNNTVCKAMAAAYEKNNDKPLAERVLAALQAAQQAGGDIRGKQSAAILVVAGQATAQPWNDKKIDLRVDDHITPLVELARLLKLYRAYEHMDAGDLASEKNDMPLAMKEYGTAMSMFPKNLEMQYWTAITLANNKKIKEAAAILQKIYKQDNNWRLLTQRLPKVGLLNTSADDYQLLIK